MKRLLSALPAILLALSSPVRAQEPLVYPGPIRRIDVPFVLGYPGPFTRVVTGKWTGHDAPDAAIVDGTSVLLAVAPAIHRAVVGIGLAANDVDRLPGGGIGGSDALVAVGPEGLVTWAWDFAARSPVVSPLAGLEWMGARAVRVGDIDGSGTPDVAAISADGTTLLTMTSSGGVLSHGPSVVFSGGIRAIEILDWDGLGAQEIALVTALGVEIVDVHGLTLASFGGAPGADSLAVIREDGVAADRLAWITPQPSDPARQRLRLLSCGGEDQPIDLGELGVVACGSGDVDGDGDDDLALSQTASHDVILLFNLRPAGPPAFSSAPGAFAFVRYGPESPPASNAAWPALADIDGDGDGDLLFPAEEEKALLRVDSPLVSEGEVRPRVAAAAVPGSGGSWDFFLELNRVALGDPPPPAGATHVEVVLWRQADESEPLDPASLTRFFSPLPADPSEEEIAVIVPIPEAALEPFAAVYAVQLRFVARSGGATTHAFPPFLGAYASSDSARAHLLNLPDSLGPPISVDLSKRPDGGSYTGIIVPRPSLEPPPEGGVPSPGPPP